ncbi:hypothetical protein AL538_09270 [Vibrio harveyi]|uniref:Uncharacterized protein n=1 Tax=Vibrio harveyi TaxID=669 RepID=A0A3A1PXG2_VIBHA|nr:hypothetical protein AL538_09270 [Vibrio harveyi]RIW10049.1 hypothetical protein DS957_017870 [Vibrio harveyi]
MGASPRGFSLPKIFLAALLKADIHPQRPPFTSNGIVKSRFRTPFIIPFFTALATQKQHKQKEPPKQLLS